MQSTDRAYLLITVVRSNVMAQITQVVRLPIFYSSGFFAQVLVQSINCWPGKGVVRLPWYLLVLASNPDWSSDVR